MNNHAKLYTTQCPVTTNFSLTVELVTAAVSGAEDKCMTDKDSHVLAIG